MHAQRPLDSEYAQTLFPSLVMNPPGMLNILVSSDWLQANPSKRNAHNNTKQAITCFRVSVLFCLVKALNGDCVFVMFCITIPITPPIANHIPKTPPDMRARNDGMTISLILVSAWSGGFPVCCSPPDFFAHFHLGEWTLRKKQQRIQLLIQVQLPWQTNPNQTSPTISQGMNRQRDTGKGKR